MMSLSEDYAAVADAVRREVRDPSWHAKSLAPAGDELRVRTISDRGRQLSPSAIQLFFGDFAVARADTWAPASSIILLLFKTEGTWRIAGEASIEASQGSRATEFNPQTAAREVLDVLHGYYLAVEHGDPRALQILFHAQWHMKNHEGPRVVAEDRDRFARRLADRPTPGYCRDRQIADIQVMYDRLACVRIDKPSTPGVTVFLFFRVAGRWLIVDKAWSMARASS